MIKSAPVGVIDEVSWFMIPGAAAGACQSRGRVISEGEIGHLVCYKLRVLLVAE